MFSALIGSVVAASTTTALSAFSKGVAMAAMISVISKGGTKATLSSKK